MSFVGSNILAGASGQGGSGYEIERSLRFNNGDSPNLSKTFGAGNRKTWTWSGWIKRSSLGTGKYSLFGGSGTNSMIRFNNDNGGDQLRVLDAATGGYDLITNRYFRDTSAWYHFVVAIDTTQSTAADRVKIYVNGVQETSFFNSSYPTQNADLTFNNNISHTIGYAPGSTYYDGYLADVHFIDGQALAPTDFGETDDNGVWQPKEFEGAYSQAASGTTTALSQTGWATSGGNSQSNIWDGNTSTQANGYNGGIIGTVTFNPPLTNVTKVELYTQNYHHYLNGSQITTSESSTEWHTYYDNSGSPITLNSVGNSYTNNTQTVDLMAIRINGSIIDSQNWTPPSGIGLQGTGDNSFHLPFSDNSSNAALGTDTSGNNNTWTVNNLTASSNNLEISASEVTNHNSVSNYLNVFDGDITTTTSGGDNAYITWTPATNISVSKFEAYFDNSLPNYQIVIAVAGGSTQTITIDSTEGWEEYTSLSGDTIGPNNAVTFNTIRPNGTNCGLHDLNAIRINNKIVTTNSSGPDIDSLVDSPTNGTQTDTGAGGEVVGNYATFNPLRDDRSGYTEAPTNGNLETNPRGDFVSTIPVTSGKYYWEITIDTQGDPGQSYIGIVDQSQISTSGSRGWSTSQIAAIRNTGAFYGDGSTGTAVTFAAGDILGFALDADNNKLWISKNGTYVNSGNPTGGTGHAFSGMSFSAYLFIVSDSRTGNKYTLNAGQRAYNTAAPTGFKAWCTANLPTPTIADGSQYFDTKLYTGNDTQRDISGLSFSPDLVWIKKRNTTGNHSLMDAVRGATKNLVPNDTQGEGTEPGYLNAFNSNGFSLGASSIVNGNNDTYAAWAWDAGSSTVSNTDGSITSQVRANLSAGFSICTYTGTEGGTFGHGLNAAPEFVIVKRRNAAAAWCLWHTAIPNTQYLMLDSTAGANTANVWGDTSPTSSVVSVSGDSYTGNLNGILTSPTASHLSRAIAA